MASVLSDRQNKIDMQRASGRRALQMGRDANIWTDFTVQFYMTIKQICKMKRELILAILDGVLISVQCLVQSPSIFSFD